MKSGRKYEYTDEDGNLRSGTFKLGFEPTYDQNGEIDFDAYQDKMFDAYNKKIDEWNRLSADAQEKRQSEFDAWFEEWDKVMEQIQKYEEALDRIREAYNEVLDMIS